MFCLFYQQLAKEHEYVSQEVRAEVDAWRRRAELEDSAFHDLLQTDSKLSQETRRVHTKESDQKSPELEPDFFY